MPLKAKCAKESQRSLRRARSQLGHYAEGRRICRWRRQMQRSFAWWLRAALESAGLRMTNIFVRYPLRESAAGWFGVCRFVVGGVEDYRAVEAFAVAFGAEVGLVAQGDVDDAALAGGHGGEVKWSSGLANFFGGYRGGHAEFLQADGALVFAVEGNLFV